MLYADGTNSFPEGTLVVGKTPINGGTSGFFLYDNGGIIGEQPGSGSGTVTQVNTGTGLVGGPITTNGTVSLSTTLLVSDIAFVIDGGGSAITTGTKGYLEVPFPCTVSVATLLADQVGSVVVDVWKCTYSQFDAGATHPVSADTITGVTPPTIGGATKSQDASLSGWTTSIATGDILAFNVNSAAAIQRVTLSLKVIRS